MKKSVIYAFCSTEQNHEKCIQKQLDACIKYATDNDIEIVKSFVEVGNYKTGKKRPVLNQLLKESKKQEWDCVLISSTDRLSRNAKISKKIYEKLKKRNIELTFCNMGMNLELLLTIMQPNKKLSRYANRYLPDVDEGDDDE